MKVVFLTLSDLSMWWGLLGCRPPFGAFITIASINFHTHIKPESFPRSTVNVAQLPAGDPVFFTFR